MDFIDLNKACPKLCRVSFLDAISEYHQIFMDTEYVEKVTFITDEGVLCYKVMLFGLKDVRATYQSFKKVYVDDIMVKRCILEDHMDNV